MSPVGAGLCDDGAGARRGRVSVAEVHRAGGEFLDFGEGFIGLVGGGVRGCGRDVGAGLSGDDVDVVDGVADEQGVFQSALK